MIVDKMDITYYFGKMQDKFMFFSEGSISIFLTTVKTKSNENGIAYYDYVSLQSKE